MMRYVRANSDDSGAISQVVCVDEVAGSVRPIGTRDPVRRWEPSGF